MDLLVAAAFLGGLLYGFSAYMTWNTGRGVYLFLIFVPCPPIIFLLLHEILVRQHWRPGRTGALLAAVCTVQFFVSTEVLAETAVMGAIAIVLLVVVDRRAMVERWRYAVIAFAIGLAVVSLLLFYPLWVTFFGPQHINGAPSPPSLIALYPADLLSTVIPVHQWLNPKVVMSTGASLFYGGALYLGLPLIIALAAFAVFLRKRRAILLAGALALIAFVLSLGSHLWVGGHKTLVVLPFAVFIHIPTLQDLFPDRLALFTGLFTAGMFAIGIDELWRRLGKPNRLAWLSPRWSTVGAAASVTVISVLAILPLVPDHAPPTAATSPPYVPSFFTSNAVDAIPVGSVVLTYPYPDSQTNGIASLYFPAENAMLDQAIAGMRFKLIGGYGWFPSPTGHFGTVSPAMLEPQSVQSLFDTALIRPTQAQRIQLSKRNLTADLRAFLRRYHVETVLILNSDGASTVVAHVTAAIGRPVESGGVTAWFHVKQRLASVGR
ncbi:MAG: hypothetical protein ACRDYE_04585 [Acidimicrobiales bacterium]